ncbi:MAG: hypothetical protein ACI841_003936 [Planctomycetota bacterium]|jgi:hypothetical protein
MLCSEQPKDLELAEAAGFLCDLEGFAFRRVGIGSGQQRTLASLCAGS